jgi:histidinol dehydrogenase
MNPFDIRVTPEELLLRPSQEGGSLSAVREIIEEVRSRGDAALLDYTERFDGVKLDDLAVTTEEIEKAAADAPAAFIRALDEASRRIEGFAQQQVLHSWSREFEGRRIGEQVSAVARAGAYIPGGKATYPSTVLMTTIPAKVAGVGGIVLCVPPGPDGKVPAPTLTAAHHAGIREIFKVGGAQAIAAMAFGTETIQKVDVIVGPGNIFVALAKREVAGLVGIDSITGPTEIAVVADKSADPRMIAFDLISQAEHGPNGAFTLISWDEDLLGKVAEHVALSLDEIEASTDLRAALEEGLRGAIVKGKEDAAELINRLAPEHLELIFEGAEDVIGLFENAGAIFVGAFAPVSLGDYLAGTNHVLPTGGAARWASGLRASHFQKTSALVFGDKESLGESRDWIRILAELEGLPNHSRAVDARFDHNRRTDER